ncbi:UNVERIFIED_CONTAM: hypothetical protein Sradi_2907200 [Sesamum radiatum]|uniref:Uncharacterized protein n=1 Tax=Sesamum radiatum TaxID=300843 RepID=A0AAW2RZ54_SESRA
MTAPHYGQILRPDRKAREGTSGVPCGNIARCRHTEWAMDLGCGPTRARHTGRPRRRRGPTMHRVSVGREIGVRAHAGAAMPRRGEDAPCHRGCVGKYRDCDRDV